MSPRLIEELISILESCSRGMADGGARRHLACRLLLLARCALGYSLMALQAIFMKAFHAPSSGATYLENGGVTPKAITDSRSGGSTRLRSCRRSRKVSYWGRS